MVDIKFIRENQDELKEAIKNKGIALDLDELLAVDAKRVELQLAVEQLRESRNKLNDNITKAKGDVERQSIIRKGKEVKEKLADLEPKFSGVSLRFDELMARVPTIPSSDTPVGRSDADNVEVYRWGEPKKFNFEPKDHIALGKSLDILDFDKGAKVGGFRGYYVKNDGVLLAMGIMMYAIKKMVSKGYRPMIPPTLVKSFALFGSGYFKGLEYDAGIDEIYEVATSDKEVTGEVSKDKKFLVGTAEPSLLAYYSGDILKEEDLPLKVCGYSQCYRSEIGSYGKETKGLYRVHEFMKVEQVVLTTADVDRANKLQDEMTAISGEMHEELGLPYRRIQICTGDMSAGKYRAFDLEAWLPGMKKWGETGSASNFLDWQARRLNIRYTDKNGEKKYVYLLNNTALPSPRIFIAILENYQTKDGHVKVPKVLREYVGKKEIGD
ncbi:MAG: serine--tRNA ligase [Patescibacteria group bacterium]|nr:serine--tRNA ligase [Patescibacteria group bacterium]MCL5224144.1 serine--tRNA ligase [Patescibacteria group bacterium]